MQAVATSFEQLVAAVNVLKHGRGRSYEWLFVRKESLPFVVKARDQHFLLEGDVSEPDTLVFVDDEFILSHADLIESAAGIVQSVKPDIYFN